MKDFWKIILKFFLISILMIIATMLTEINTKFYIMERVIFIILCLISFMIFISIIVEPMYIFSKQIKKRNENINEDYYNNLESIFYEFKYKLENKRKETINKLIIMIFVFFTLMICNIVFMKFNFLLRIILFILSLIIFAIIAKKYENSKKKYRMYYKETIINDLVKEIDINLRYNPDGDEKNFKRFLEAGYIEPDYNNHIITDTIFLSNVLVINKIKLICNNRKVGDYLSDIFMFSYNKIDRNIPLNINIKRNSKQNNEEINKFNFNKYFDLKYNIGNQIIDDILKIVIEYYNKYSTDLNIKINNNNICIKFYTGDILEAPFLLKKVENLNIIKSCYRTIYGIIEICNNLKNVIEESDM